ncbi:MAG TPA: hypothetical protein VG245_07470 [Candidatus Dormibacteraeota bacterium]|jgi:hypothetical protein|nr:hypothetical protein [Candidatus Dormibacteraeota bacterium]
MRNNSRSERTTRRLATARLFVTLGLAASVALSAGTVSFAADRHNADQSSQSSSSDGHRDQHRHGKGRSGSQGSAENQDQTGAAQSTGGGAKDGAPKATGKDTQSTASGTATAKTGDTATKVTAGPVAAPVTASAPVAKVAATVTGLLGGVALPAGLVPASHPAIASRMVLAPAPQGPAGAPASSAFAPRQQVMGVAMSVSPAGNLEVGLAQTAAVKAIASTPAPSSGAAFRIVLILGWAALNALLMIVIRRRRARVTPMRAITLGTWRYQQ